MTAQTPHARDAGALERIEPQAAAFEAALASGRMHHAWLLTGPRGLGKAAFAYRVARRLLGARPDGRFGPLGCSPQDAVNRMVAARSHPDLLALDIDPDDPKAKASITVDEARRAPAFFAKAPAIAPYRVAIIDAVDDMNVNAENALLKTLEEPSGRGVLLLVSHAPGRLLPTVRSRCRRLAFTPWPEAAVARFAELRLGVQAEQAAALARMGRGSPGRALSLHAAGGLEAETAARILLGALPQPDPSTLAGLSDGFRGAEGAARFHLWLDGLGDAVHAGVEMLPSGAADRWARAWARLASLQGQADGLNLDRGDAFWAAVAELRAAAEVSPLPC